MIKYIPFIGKEFLRKQLELNTQPCAHDGCSSCHGTGKKEDGSFCVHMLYCSCPKCSPQC